METNLTPIHLYLGCDTNKGKFVGITNDILSVQKEDSEVVEFFEKIILGKDLFLYLRKLDSLTDVQRKELIHQGINIGRPHGYTFSNKGFLYLLSLHVDLFGLINSGIAKDITTL